VTLAAIVVLAGACSSGIGGGSTVDTGRSAGAAATGLHSASEAPSSVAPPSETASASSKATTEGAAPILTPPPGAVVVEMFGPPPQFRPKRISAAAGEIVFYLQNDSPRSDPHGAHQLVIGSAGGGQVLAKSDIVPGGGRTIFTVELPAGTYDVWCPLAGHASLGQTATLTVE
jgi:hypothetical protein